MLAFWRTIKMQKWIVWCAFVMVIYTGKAGVN